MAVNDVQGVVEDANGDPVDGATVYAIRTDTTPAECVGKDVSGPSGEYLIPAKFNGEVHLVAEWEPGEVNFRMESNPFISVERKIPQKLVDQAVQMGSGEVRGINVSNGDVNFDTNLTGSRSTPAFYDGSYYTMAKDGSNTPVVEEIDSSSGGVLSTFTIGSNESSQARNTLVYKDTVYAAAVGYVTSLTPDLSTENWNDNSGGSSSFTNLAIADDDILCAQVDSIRRIDRQDGSVVWNRSLGGATHQLTARGDTYLDPFSGSLPQGLVKLDSDNNVVWGSEFSPLRTQSVVTDRDNGRVYVSTLDNGLVVMDDSDGSTISNLTSYPRSDGLAIYDGSLIFTTNEGSASIYSVNLSTLDQEWSSTVTDSSGNTLHFDTSPKISSGVIYASSSTSTSDVTHPDIGVDISDGSVIYNINRSLNLGKTLYYISGSSGEQLGNSPGVANNEDNLPEF